MHAVTKEYILSMRMVRGRSRVLCLVGGWVGFGGCRRCASVLGADLVGQCGGVGVPATAA